MELKAKFDAKAIEQDVREYLEKVNIRKLLGEELASRKRIGFVEGPPTMNGEPHVGHLRGRVIKDLWYRFSTLKKLNVVFRAGWDAQGLPVELQAEKELGLSGSKAENLKKVGMEKIVEQCKKLVHRYNERWVEADKLLGMSLDYEKAYWTYRDHYIEREWKYLQKAWEQGILVEGYQVVAYCPSCQTSLSHSEVTQGYEMVQDPSLYYKVKLVDAEEDDNAYLIVWTTMPFTVVTDEMVGVNPDAEYAYVKAKDETWIVAEERAEQVMAELKVTEYSIVKKVMGEALDGKRYLHPLLEEISGLKELADKIHIVVAEKFVDIQTGSGVVHLSPANGEEDFEIATNRGLPIFNPIDDQVRFTEQAGNFRGLFVRDADQRVVEALKEHGALVRISKIKHEYPTCWRSHHKLVWLARREYFNMLEKVGGLALDAIQKVDHFYNEPKNRFVGIIKEHKPWCVSRERVWGAPLPIWSCTNCKHKTALFSRAEILEKALKLPDGEDFELHRPWIDRVVVKCDACGSDSYREPFVLDTWHNSGAAPFASFTDDEFGELVPVPFLTEGIDQTRGWAYTLLIENVILNRGDKAPFESFLFQGHVLDEKGNKMSKSLGNVIDGVELLKKNPADLVRFYFMWKANPIDALNFSVEEMNKRAYQVLSTLYYLHIYLRQNSTYDGFDASRNTIGWTESGSLIRNTERWLLSRLQDLIETVTDGYERCRYHDATRAIEEFVINHLSQTYVPLTRNEIWDDSEENLERRLAIYSTLAYVLRTVDVLLHPVCPFITDYLHMACFRERSILLEEWPGRETKFVDKSIERSFSLLREIISLANAARMKASLKRRWPLKDAYICIRKDDVKALEPVDELLSSQLNVSQFKVVGLEQAGLGAILLTMIENGLPVIPKLSLKRGNVAPKVRADMGMVLSEFSKSEDAKVLKVLERDGKYDLGYGDGKKVEITKDDVEIGYEAPAGHAVAERENIFVMISTVRDKDLTAKGLARDLARRLQSLRKERGYNPTQILDSAYIAGLDDEAIELLQKMLDEMAFLVRVKKVQIMRESKGGVNWSEKEIDGKPIHLSVE
ncbi:MAG: isoleucine--tRNA ligase [Nitrososphaerales archaeon]